MTRPHHYSLHYSGEHLSGKDLSNGIQEHRRPSIFPPCLEPPIINSEMGTKYGIKAPCMVEPGQYTGIEAGNNVKLRLVLDGGEKRITCHGKIDWVKSDKATGRWYVGFGSLSLSDDEFRLLARNFVEQGEKPVEFVRKVRDKAAEAETVVVVDTIREIMRYKAVKFPVSVIEAIEIMREDTAFSEFVVNAVRAYVKKGESSHIVTV